MHSGSRCLLVSELESCSSIIQITLCFELPCPPHQTSQVTDDKSPNIGLLKASLFINEQLLNLIIAACKRVNLVIISHPPWYHPVFLFRTIPQEADKTQLKIRANLFVLLPFTTLWSIIIITTNPSNHHHRRHGDIYLVALSANYITSDAWCEEKPWQIAQEKHLMCL